MTRFFVGVDDVHFAGLVGPAFVSVNRLRNRKSPFPAGDWIMDSGAFTEVARHGGYREEPEAYAEQIRRWANNGNLLAAVSQDWMCEPWVVKKTGLSVHEHQRLTVDRYERLLACDRAGVYLMPVLQGYSPSDYVRHLEMYGDLLGYGQWVGVGSVCKRNGKPEQVARVLHAIKRERPDLLLHGFGVKQTSLADADVRSMLHTADSMAWSFAARYEGRDAHDWREARKWRDMIDGMCACDGPRRRRARLTDGFFDWVELGA